MPKLKKLTKEQYYEWKCFIFNTWLQESKLREKELKVALLEKDVEISRLRAGLVKTNLINEKEKVVEAKKEYEEYKSELEKIHKLSLDGCIIDEITFEIKKLEVPSEK